MRHMVFDGAKVLLDYLTAAYTYKYMPTDQYRLPQSPPARSRRGI